MNSTSPFKNVTDEIRQRATFKRSIPNGKHEFNENSHSDSGDSSCFSSFSYGGNKKPTLPDAALYGPAGEIVKRILPCTEADPAALYAQLLTGLGNMIGPSPYFVADGSKHRANLFTIICGATAKARKGTSWNHIRNVLDEIDDLWLSERVKSGVVSGEGVTQVFEGTEERRLLLFEGEFAQVLQVMRREGNTVSVLLRQAWDGSKLAVIRKKDPIEVDGAHLSMIGHITLPELNRLLASVEMSNGLANRCLWVFSDRSKLLPDGGRVPHLADILPRLQRAVESASKRGELRRDNEARIRWQTIYAGLSEPPLGRMGEITSRAEAQVMRVALLLALLDESPSIGVSHLDAALEFWKYCETSAGYIFAGTFANPRATKIWEALAKGPHTMAMIHALFSNNASKHDIDAALEELAPLTEIQAGGPGGMKTIRRKEAGDE